MTLTPDWINFHYSGKSGVTCVESKKIGDYFEMYLNAEYLGELQTEIGVYYKYKVKDLAIAFKAELKILPYIF